MHPTKTFSNLKKNQEPLAVNFKYPPAKVNMGAGNLPGRIKKWLSGLFTRVENTELKSTGQQEIEEPETELSQKRHFSEPDEVSCNTYNPGIQDNYRITGRIRNEDNLAVEGYTVQAFDKDTSLYFHPDDKLGRSRTNKDGSFEINFSKDDFSDWFEGDPEVYLTIRDRNGSVLITTGYKENTTKDMDFQIKLGKSEIIPFEPDIYAGNFERMIAALKNVADIEDISGTDVSVVFELFLRTLNSWTIYRDELVSLSGYDGIQVPGEPRKTEHDHVTRWDRMPP